MSDTPETSVISDDDLRETLYDVIADVLEQFAFMFTAPVEDTPVRHDEYTGRMHHAEIRFSGPFSGRLILCASSSFCLMLAANVLGMEPDELTREHAGDSLKELVNVACGELLVALSGKKTVFNLSVPVLKNMDAAAIQTLLNQPGTIPVMVDEEPLIISANLTAS